VRLCVKSKQSRENSSRLVLTRSLKGRSKKSARNARKIETIEEYREKDKRDREKLVKFLAAVDEDKKKE